ncbi:MAG: hypothetical protein V1702_02000 [Candidatus Woesearchaeota archaeon]
MMLMKESMFVRMFGNSPKIKVIDFLLDNSGLDWSKSDMARQTGISRATLDGFFDSLVKDSIIVPTRIIGRARLFRLNTQLAFVKKLIELDMLISRPLENKIKA